MIPLGIRSSSAAALCAAALFFASAARATGLAGMSEGPGDDSNADVYLAAGAAVLVGAIILWDALSDDVREIEPATEPEPALVPTGVDWAAVDSALSIPLPLLGVSIASGDLSGPAGRLLEALRSDPGGAVSVLPDLLDLGGAGGEESFAMASAFFGVNALVLVTGREDSPGLSLLTASGPLWSGSLDPEASVSADSILSALRNPPQ